MPRQRIMNQLITLLVILLTHFGLHGQGSIKGVVKDKVTGETIVGANIILRGTYLGAATNLDGSFHITNIPSGTYMMICSYISYKPVEMVDMNVESGKTIELVIEMEPHANTILGVTISARRVYNTEASVIGTLRSSNLVLSGISAEQISRSPDGDAAQVVKRVPGITIVGNRFVMIRGLSERYSAVMLHGVYAPSMEADVRSFSFDVVPSAMIDRVLIYKSPSPELPGDFSGGVVKIYTKSIPEQNSTQISYSTAFRKGSTFAPFYAADKGSLYFTGFNNGFENLPDDFPNDIRQIDADPQEVDRYGKALRNNWIATPSTLAPDQSVSVNLARRFMIKGRQAGSISAISYSNSARINDVRRRDYNAYDLERELKSPIYDAYDENFGRSIRLGILSNWSIEINEKHSIDFKNLFNQLSSSEYIHRTGRFIEFNYNANNHSFYQIYRGIYSGQITGQHKFTENATSDWILGFGYSYRDEPDYRRFRSDLDTITGTSTLYVPFGTAQAYFLGRFFSQMTEYNYTAAFNHKQIIDSDRFKTKPVLSAGFFSEYRQRDFSARNIGYVRSSITQFDNGLLDVAIDSLFHTENINQTTGIRIDEQSNPSDSYDATNLLIAGYANLMLPLTKKLNFNLGARLESNVQKLNSFTLTNDPVNVEQPIISLLPSSNFTYNHTEKMLIRLAYGKTLNRPEFRELAPFGFYDFNYNLVRKGSDSIRIAYIHNFDLRWEYYPTPSELITFGIFYKSFQFPIENSFVPGGGTGGIKTFTFANAASAQNWGAEIEIRHSLDGYTNSRHISNLSVVFNAAFINSQVELGAAALGQAVDNRLMYGQSPYIVNAGLYYNDNPTAIQVALLYNVIGQRIFIIGYDDYPDIYELPRNLIDLSISKTFRKVWELKLGINDILNEDYLLIQDANRDGIFDQEKDHVMQIYSPGTRVSMGLSYKF
jgi:hypothetical protein